MASRDNESKTPYEFTDLLNSIFEELKKRITVLKDDQKGNSLDSTALLSRVCHPAEMMRSEEVTDFGQGILCMRNEQKTCT